MPLITPTTRDRPTWIAPELWFRMSWSARMRAARRALYAVPAPETDDGEEVTHGGIGGTSAPVAPAPAPSSSTPGAVLEGKAAAAPGTEPDTGAASATAANGDDAWRVVDAPAPVPAPAWLRAAHSNRHALCYLQSVGRGHVTHPVPGAGGRWKSRAYRPVMP